MSLALVDRSVVPPGQFVYTQKETGYTMREPTWPDLIRTVKKHRLANNLPIGAAFEREVESQLADKLQAAGAGNFVKPYEPPPKIPVPREEWPIWAKAIALAASPEDKGVGDTVARTIGDRNSARFKAWFKTIFDRDCNCADRHAAWDTLYPY